MHALRRLTVRFLPIAMVATTFAIGAPFEPAGATKVNVTTSSVQVTGESASTQSSVVTRSMQTTNGTHDVTDAEKPAPAGFHAVVENPNGGQMVGFVWNGSPNATLQLRSQNGDVWSPWLDAQADSYGDVDPGEGNVRPGVGPFWIGDNARAVEVRVDAGTLADLRVDVLHLDVQNPQGGIKPAGAALMRPSIISRAEWGAEPWASSTAGCGSGPDVAPAREAIIHHTAGVNDYSPAQAYGIVHAIQTFEIQSRGFCDLSYNFMVSRYGQIFEGRTDSIYKTVIGGHARGSNTGSIGIALMGEYQPGESIPAAQVTTAQYNSLRDLLAWKFAWHGIDALATVNQFTQCVSDASYQCKYPTGTFLALPAIVGHRDVTQTACPGDNVMPLLPRLRAEVAAEVVRSGPFYPLENVQWQPDPSRPAVVTLDAYGGMHPGGAANAVPGGNYWPGWPIARGIAGTPTAGYVLDGWGGVAAYGTAAPIQFSPIYWRGWDIARAISLASAPASGYIVDGWGGVHPFGNVSPPTGAAYWGGWDIARDIVTLPNGTGGYTLDGWGGVHAFGSAPPIAGGPYWRGWDIARAIALNPDGPGLYLLDGFGGVHALGGAPPLAVSHYTNTDVHRDLVVLSGGRGYVLDSDGHAWPVGSAPSMPVQLTWTRYGIGRGLVGL